MFDKGGCMLFCSYSNSKKGTNCPGLKASGNIVGGCASLGYTFPGHDCGAGETQETFRNNVAHSVNDMGNGFGAIVYPDPTKPGHKTCYECSFFKSYKCRHVGLYASWPTKKLIFNGLVSVDNAKGIGGQAKQEFNKGEMNDFGVEYNDLALYGDYAPSKDCPKDGGYCVKYEKAGLFGPVCSAGESYDMHAQKSSALPMYKHQANVGAWGGRAVFNRVKFKGYLSKTE
jgi:hypothetical protein